METKILLDENQMPKQWYNIAADLPKPLPPPMNLGTGKPIGPEDLAPIFPMGLIKQEVSTERWIGIPEEVRDILKMWRPSPLYRAHRFEEAIGTKARIYYKYEGVSPPGSHKPNTAVAQAYYNMKEGVERLTTETGAGQWGSALSFATQLLGLECTVYMVRCSYDQKPYRKVMMKTWGGDVYSSPSTHTKTGRTVLEEMPDTPGSLGIAISEAVEDAVSHDNAKYALGSVLNHVMLHQTVIGLEAKEQLAMVEDYPDVVIGCCGGGSNFSGISFPFLHDKLREGKDVRAIAVEPASCPTLTKGPYAYDFGDTAQMTPLLKMYTLGHNFVPPGIHAGGLRYHGDAPLVSALYNQGVIEAQSYHQLPCFEAAIKFARSEGIIVAPETSHAIRSVIEEAKDADEGKVILFNLSGHGHLDLSAYEAYFGGKLTDHEHPPEQVEECKKMLAGYSCNTTDYSE